MKPTTEDRVPTTEFGRRHALVALLTIATPAFAHADDALTPATWARAWSWEPGIVASLFFAAALYATGQRWFRRASVAGADLRAALSSDAKRQTQGRPEVGPYLGRTGIRRDGFYFWTGWLILAIALVSPIHPLGQVLFSVHMVQHELLMVAAAPLLVLGRPVRVWLWAMPRSSAKTLGGWSRRWHGTWAGQLFASPFVAFIAHAAALWVWHVPRFFESTLDSDALHALQHACFLGTALWFWDTVFFGPRRRAGYGMAVLYLFLTALHSGALGALITFAGAPWYPRYAATAPVWGYGALQDQQLGGLIMWVPAGLSYVIAALALFASWLRETEQRQAGPHLRAAPSSSERTDSTAFPHLQPGAAGARPLP